MEILGSGTARHGASLVVVTHLREKRLIFQSAVREHHKHTQNIHTQTSEQTHKTEGNDLSFYKAKVWNLSCHPDLMCPWKNMFCTPIFHEPPPPRPQTLIPTPGPTHPPLQTRTKRGVMTRCLLELRTARPGSQAEYALTRSTI